MTVTVHPTHTISGSTPAMGKAVWGPAQLWKVLLGSRKVVTQTEIQQRESSSRARAWPCTGDTKPYAQGTLILGTTSAQSV